MAGQALFFRTCSLLSNNRAFLNIRALNVNLLPSVRDLKQDTVERLKLLKIPDKPKKPRTPYVRFLTEHRIKVVKNNPNLKPTEIIKKCAEDWKNVSEELKEKYNIEYKDECVIYDQNISTFNANLTPQQKEALKNVDEEKKTSRQKRKVKKIERETNKPKRPMGPYAQYVIEQSKIRNVSAKELITSLKDEWANLSKEEKNKYHNKFLKEKETYEEAMAEWEEKMIKEGRSDLIRVKSVDKLKASRISQLKKDNPQ